MDADRPIIVDVRTGERVPDDFGWEEVPPAPNPLKVAIRRQFVTLTRLLTLGYLDAEGRFVSLLRGE